MSLPGPASFRGAVLRFLFVRAAAAVYRVNARFGFVRRRCRAIQFRAGVLLVVFGTLGQMGRWLPAFSPGGCEAVS